MTNLTFTPILPHKFAMLRSKKNVGWPSTQPNYIQDSYPLMFWTRLPLDRCDRSDRLFPLACSYGLWYRHHGAGFWAIWATRNSTNSPPWNEQQKVLKTGRILPPPRPQKGWKIRIWTNYGLHPRHSIFVWYIYIRTILPHRNLTMSWDIGT